LGTLSTSRIKNKQRRLEIQSFDFAHPESVSDFFFVCDHGGNFIPGNLENLGLLKSDLERHIAYDIGALGVARILAETFSAPLVWQNYSRLLIDCNRQLDHKNLIPTESDNTTIPNNKSLRQIDRADRVSNVFMPYHRKIEELLDFRESLNQQTIFVSMHSFTPVMDGYKRPWHIGVLSAGDRSFSDAVKKHLEKNTEYVIGDNEPYRIDDKDFTVPQHAVERSLPSVLIEIRQDLVETVEGQISWASFIAEALSEAKKIL